MAMNGNALGDAIRTAIAGVGDKTDTTAIWQAIGTAIVTYIVANMEINGVEVTLDQTLHDIFDAGTPNAGDGGADLQTEWKDQTDSGAYDDATQSNDGTGRVA